VIRRWKVFENELETFESFDGKWADFVGQKLAGWGPGLNMHYMN
jgi:hypothetical protein